MRERVCVCVCKRESEREREKEKKIKKKIKKQQSSIGIDTIALKHWNIEETDRYRDRNTEHKYGLRATISCKKRRKNN